MDGGSLVRKFQEAQMCLTPGALQLLEERGEKEAERVLEALRGKEFIVTPELVRSLLEPAPQPAEEVGGGEEVRGFSRLRPLAAEVEDRVEVLRDVTGKSYSKGEVRDFLRLFLDRYERLKGLLMKRSDYADPLPLGELVGMEEGGEVRVVGMVAEKRETPGGHLMLRLEDPTGTAAVWVYRGKSEELLEKAAEVILDEVIGVEGTLRSGDKVPRIVARDIAWPDLPTPKGSPKVEEPVCAALLSDLHVGSKMFLREVFERFLSWLEGKVGGVRQRDLASRTKYVVVAGDLVDGIGVYPQQEEELYLHDIFRQYEEVAGLLERIPDHIKIILSPGNHDAVRPSEPQPAIPKEVAGRLYDLNTVMVGNPAWISLHGLKFLIYHGRSFDDLVSTLPGNSRKDVSSMMIRLLRARHLAPMYGGKVAVVPEERDFLVIDEVPDVLHCGHLHLSGCKKYKGVWAINSGTFQSMTSYMRERGIVPTPGVVTVIDLQKNEPSVMRLA
jgi:DNA polymerase II small subunit